MVPDPDAGGDAGQMLETTIQMQQLLQFIWKHRSIFDVTERVEICGVAKASDCVFCPFFLPCVCAQHIDDNHDRHHMGNWQTAW